nr:Os07g0643500 [Ipomoea trifida]
MKRNMGIYLKPPETGFRCSLCHVVGQVSPGTISGKKAVRHVSVFWQYPIVLLIIEESQHVESIVVLSRVAVLRGQAIVNGNDDRRDFARKSAANCIVLLGVGAEVHEAAAVEEDDYGEGSGIPRLVARGDEDTEPEVAGRVEGDVGGLDAVDRVAVGGNSDGEYLEETAVHGAILAARGVGDGGDKGKGYAAQPEWERNGSGSIRPVLNSD